MPAIRTGFSAEDLLPEEIRGAIRRRIREIGGVALLALAAAAALALASWSVQDPSLSHATSAPVRNLLGVPGAIAADLMMQLIGLASIALLLPLAGWGWGVAPAPPSLARSRAAAARTVARRRARRDGVCFLLAAEPGLAAADRAGRGGRRRAAAPARMADACAAVGRA